MRAHTLLLFAVIAVLAVVTVSAQYVYPEALARRGAYFAAASTCNTDAISGWECLPCKNAPGITEAVVFEKNTALYSAFGFVAYDAHEDAIVIVFRGTDDLADWIGNIDIIKTNLWNAPNVRVHEGFLRGYDAVREQWLDDFQAHLKAHPTAHIQIFGHSLGGAQATLCAVDLKYRLNVTAPLTLITYGAPRVGADNSFYPFFVEYVPLGTSWRIAHNHDIVPDLPPSYVGFEHVPINVWYNAGNTSYKQCEPTKDCGPTINLSTADHHVYVGVPLSCDLTATSPLPDDYVLTHLSPKVRQALIQQLQNST